MKTIVINENNINKEEIDYKVVRVKAFLVNSNGEILLAHNNNTYQLIGGHLTKNETLEECLSREIQEETGIIFNNINLPFCNIITFDSNYFDSLKKVENSIYYYKLDTNAVPDFNNTNYDDIEKQSAFNLFYVKEDQFKDFIIKCINEGTMDKRIAKEMLLVIEEYYRLFK